MALPPAPGPAPAAGPQPARPPGTVTLEADAVQGIPDGHTEARGTVVLQRDGLEVRADHLRLDQPGNRVRAEGAVEARRGADRFTGSAFDLTLETEVGSLLSPSYFFAITGAGGTADRIDFLGPSRALVTAGSYTSCPADGSGDPDWLLTARRVRLDFTANEGIAEGAVVRFLGLPILALPALSFPLTGERKTGWLPPSVNVDTRSGLDLSVPWYWNLAPDMDATIAPRIMTRRGLAVATELRHLGVDRRGTTTLDLVARDALTGTSRWAFGGAHDGRLVGDVDWHARWLRASDDAYWKDFARGLPTTTPRLLPVDAGLQRTIGDLTTYVRLQGWQVLQGSDPAGRIVAPYQRLPQIGARWMPSDADPMAAGGLRLEAEAEFSRFVLPGNATDGGRPDGDRLHALVSAAWPLRAAGLAVTPRLSLNTATYALLGDVGRRTGSAGLLTGGSRSIPTFSLDAASVLERDATLLGRAVRQTLEPRVLYVRTPSVDQSRLPNFDAAPRDFNFESLFAENAFAGIDRVSDADQLTAGLSTRVFDAADGGELLRLAVAQRLLFRDQRVTPEGPVLSQRVSDLLLLGSTRLFPAWVLDAGLQYSPELGSATRTLVAGRFSPGPFRTVSAAYRFTRGSTEQIELGWQWPLAGAHRHALLRRGGGARCAATWYGVGRLDYSLRDSRVTDALIGVEVDAGCWIARIVAERQSTARNEANTRLLFQLELVGLARLGSSPLQALKDNVPGYQLLRSGGAADGTRHPAP